MNFDSSDVQSSRVTDAVVSVCFIFVDFVIFFVFFFFSLSLSVSFSFPFLKPSSSSSMHKSSDTKSIDLKDRVTSVSLEKMLHILSGISPPDQMFSCKSSIWQGFSSFFSSAPQL